MMLTLAVCCGVGSQICDGTSYLNACVDQYVDSYPIFTTKNSVQMKVESQIGVEILVCTEDEIQELNIDIEDVMTQDVSKILDVVAEDEHYVKFYIETDLKDVSGTFKVVHEYKGEEAGPLEKDVSLALDGMPSKKFVMENDVKDVGSAYMAHEYIIEEVLSSKNEADCVKELEGVASSLSYENKEITVDEFVEIEYNLVDEVIKEEMESKIEDDSVIELEERIPSSQD